MAVGRQHQWVTAPTALRALALLFNSRMAISQGQTEVGMRLLDEGEARRLDATVELAYAAYVRATAAMLRGDLPTAMASPWRTTTRSPTPADNTINPRSRYRPMRRRR